MSPRHLVMTLVAVLGLPTALLADQAQPLHVPLWTSFPFALLLLSIALFPLFIEHFWSKNRNKALVVAVLSIPVMFYLISIGPVLPPSDEHPLLYRIGEAAPPLKDVVAHAGTLVLADKLNEYFCFIMLLASLYTVSGGIVLRGDIQATPTVNSLFLIFGAVIANVIGTTGATMLLIRPLLQTNRERRNTRHLAVFFIFVVSNLGGVLTPLGDPPLFLGFLHGVGFLWTMSLWRPWLVANGLVLAIFFVWDTIAYRRESPKAIAEDIAIYEPLRVRGLVNLLFLAGILAAVVLQSEKLSASLADWIGQFAACPRLRLTEDQGAIVMFLMGFASWLITPRALRQSNAFTWGAMIEVAVLFVGIFITMAPALDWLSANGPTLGVTEPWQYFWLTGGLSSFLDNAPTYLTFATMAAGPHEIGTLMQNNPLVLQAISCGAVFMGANSYIGNGPNFMVKAIADESGFATPSFFGYMLYSGFILLPVFAVVTWMFFV